MVLTGGRKVVITIMSARPNSQTALSSLTAASVWPTNFRSPIRGKSDT